MAIGPRSVVGGAAVGLHRGFLFGAPTVSPENCFYCALTRSDFCFLNLPLTHNTHTIFPCATDTRIAVLQKISSYSIDGGATIREQSVTNYFTLRIDLPSRQCGTNSDPTFLVFLKGVACSLASPNLTFFTAQQKPIARRTDNCECVVFLKPCMRGYYHGHLSKA